jgi:hypothetical protein
MRKLRTYLFLGSLTVVFLIVGKKMLADKPDKNKVDVIIKTADSLMNECNPPQIKRAYNYLDKCSEKNEDLMSNKEFQKKHTRLQQLNRII